MLLFWEFGIPNQGKVIWGYHWFGGFGPLQKFGLFFNAPIRYQTLSRLVMVQSSTLKLKQNNEKTETFSCGDILK